MKYLLFDQDINCVLACFFRLQFVLSGLDIDPVSRKEKSAAPSGQRLFNECSNGFIYFGRDAQ